MLKESEISDLINQSGRLRMLSHRSGMLLSFVSHSSSPDPWFSDELEKTSTNFHTSYQLIVDKVANDADLSRSFHALLHKRAENESSIESVISDFMTKSSRLSEHLPTATQATSSSLQRFLKLIATDLLAALNKIVSFFESQLNKVSDNKSAGISDLAKEVEDSLSDVDNINLTVKMLALNASVEAARAGDAGKSFSVISKEMNDLSQQIRQVSDNIKRDLKSFVEHM